MRCLCLFKCSFMCEEYHSHTSDFPRSQSGCNWTALSSWEGASNKGGKNTFKRERVEGIFGTVTLLQEVFAKSVHFSCPTAQTATDGHKVAVRERTKAHMQIICIDLHMIWEIHCVIMWCVPVWSWCSFIEDGTERPIGFTSQTLNAVEKNYSQLDKEGTLTKKSVQSVI